MVLPGIAYLAFDCSVVPLQLPYTLAVCSFGRIPSALIRLNQAGAVPAVAHCIMHLRFAAVRHTLPGLMTESTIRRTPFCSGYDAWVAEPLGDMSATKSLVHRFHVVGQIPPIGISMDQIFQ
jgi:hypothetical protein